MGVDRTTKVGWFVVMKTEDWDDLNKQWGIQGLESEYCDVFSYAEVDDCVYLSQNSGNNESQIDLEVHENCFWHLTEDKYLTLLEMFNCYLDQWSKIFLDKKWLKIYGAINYYW